MHSESGKQVTASEYNALRLLNFSGLAWTLAGRLLHEWQQTVILWIPDEAPQEPIVIQSHWMHRQSGSFSEAITEKKLHFQSP